MPYVITITGPSGAGKSTMLDYLTGIKIANADFRPMVVPKYSTRKPRGVEGSHHEIIHVDSIPPNCDLVYEQYGDRYGVELGSIFDLLKKGVSPIIILNDIRAVEDVRNSWKELVRSVFIFRRSPSLKNYEKLAKERRVDVDEEDPEVRFRKAMALYRIYIENIHIFHHVVINSGTKPQLKKQAEQIVKGLTQIPNWPMKETR